MTKYKLSQKKKKITDYKRFGSNLDAISYSTCGYIPKKEDETDRIFNREDTYGSR